jgi:hypothetical protein
MYFGGHGGGGSVGMGGISGITHPNPTFLYSPPPPPSLPSSPDLWLFDHVPFGGGFGLLAVSSPLPETSTLVITTTHPTPNDISLLPLLEVVQHCGRAKLLV